MSKINPHRLAKTIALLTVAAFLGWFGLTGQLDVIQSKARSAARDPAIFETARQQSTTYQALQSRALRECSTIGQSGQSDPTQGYLDGLVRQGCETNVLFGTGDNFERAYRRQFQNISLEVVIVMTLIVSVAVAATYGAFFLIRFVTGIWWPWLTK
jgi:hypothetical protein